MFISYFSSNARTHCQALDQLSRLWFQCFSRSINILLALLYSDKTCLHMRFNLKRSVKSKYFPVGMFQEMMWVERFYTCPNQFVSLFICSSRWIRLISRVFFLKKINTNVFQDIRDVVIFEFMKWSTKVTCKKIVIVTFQENLI